jgi:hypothetical protein
MDARAFAAPKGLRPRRRVKPRMTLWLGLAPRNDDKKKGPLAIGKRPKSREETPKEGSDSARRYRTATICDRVAQSARIFESFPMQNLHAGAERARAILSFISNEIARFDGASCIFRLCIIVGLSIS